MINFILSKLNRKRYLAKWRKLNSNSSVYPVTNIPFEKVQIGDYSYGPIIVHYWGNSNEKLIIGKFVSIANNVQFVLGGNHHYKHLLTFPSKFKLGLLPFESSSKGPIVVEDDVWIGLNSTILSGVKIRKGAIIGAGSVVASDIPPYAIVVGNPAKIIKYRFDSKIIERLVKIDYKSIDLNVIKSNIDLFYKEIDDQVISEIENLIN